MKFCFNFYLGHLSKYPNKTSAQQTAAIDSEYKWMPACRAGCKLHTLHGLPAFVSPSGRVSTSACSSAMKPLSSKDFSLYQSGNSALYSTEGPADQAANQAADQAAVPAANQAAVPTAVPASGPPPAVAYYSYYSNGTEEPACYEESEADRSDYSEPTDGAATDDGAADEYACEEYESEEYEAEEQSEYSPDENGATSDGADDEFWREEFAMESAYNF